MSTFSGFFFFLFKKGGAYIQGAYNWNKKAIRNKILFAFTGF